MTQATLKQTEVKTDDKTVQKPSRQWKPVAEFLLFLIVGLLLLEPILKIAGVADEESYMVDKKVGWSSVPNRTATYRTEGYSRYRINSLGMRDVERTIGKAANTFRIAVVGCSITEGKQVPIEETYCRVLEKRLNKDGGPVRYEVLNFAVSAYTLGQEYLRMKHFALQFKPDLVLFTVRPNALLYMGPNNKPSFFNSRPVFGVLSDGTLVEDHNLQYHWLASAQGRRAQNTLWLSTNSRLYTLIGKCSYIIAGFKEALVARLQHPFSAKRQAAQTADALDGMGTDVRLNKTRIVALGYLGKVAAAIIKQARIECEKQHCQFALVYLPASAKNRAKEEEAIVSKYRAQLGVDLIDLNPELDLIERQSAKSLYIECHPSKFGHQKIADCLEANLKEKGLLEQRRQSMAIPRTLNSTNLN